MFAVNCVNVMNQERAVRALEADFVGTKDGLEKTQEEANAHYHDVDRLQPATRSEKYDVPKSCCRQRCDREIKGIDIAIDLRIYRVLRHIDE